MKNCERFCEFSLRQADPMTTVKWCTEVYLTMFQLFSVNWFNARVHTTWNFKSFKCLNKWQTNWQTWNGENAIEMNRILRAPSACERILNKPMAIIIIRHNKNAHCVSKHTGPRSCCCCCWCACFYKQSAAAHHDMLASERAGERRNEQTNERTYNQYLFDLVRAGTN